MKPHPAADFKEGRGGKRTEAAAGAVKKGTSAAADSTAISPAGAGEFLGCRGYAVCREAKGQVRRQIGDRLLPGEVRYARRGTESRQLWAAAAEVRGIIRRP